MEVLPLQTNNLKILIVEDSPIIKIVMENMLAITGCTPVSAMSGKEALELFQNDYYHLILMDISLPDSDGFTLSKAIRSSNDKKKANTPIVILTAHSLENSYSKQIEILDIEDFIVKPCTLDKCKQLVAKYSAMYCTS